MDHHARRDVMGAFQRHHSPARWMNTGAQEVLNSTNV
jgi:hypothetical protein